MNPQQAPVDHQVLRDRMRDSRLPVLPPGTPYLLKAMSSEEIDFNQLAAIVEKFPTIAARLISLANSTWSSPVATITSLEMACSRLGFFVVRSVSVALSIASIFNPSACPAFEVVRFWSSALLAADTASELTPLARHAKEVDVQTARTAGLLHNLGLLWLATWMPAETHRALTGIDSDPDFPIRDALNQYCGLDYCEAGALLASAWQFPDTLIQALEHQADPNYQDSSWPIANLVGLGRALNATSRSGLPPPVMDPRLNRLGIEATDLAATFQRLEAKHHEIDELAQALFAR